MSKVNFIPGQWRQGYIMHQQRMILNGQQYFAGLPDWVQNKASLSFNAEWAEYYNDYEAGKLYFRDQSFNRVAATFSRTSSATRVNKQGLIETVATGVPRIDYSDGSAKLLMEPSRTNRLTQSEDFSAYTDVGVTLTTGQTSPKDDATATLMQSDGGSADPRVLTNANMGAAGDVVGSIFAKAGTNNFIAVQLTSFAGATPSAVIAYFDLSNGTTPTAGASIVDMGNGWYRCITQPINIDAVDLNGFITVRMTPDTSNLAFASAAAADGKSVYIWGFQVEAGSYPTSYIPTAGSAVTRNGDSASISSLQSNNHLGLNTGTIAYLYDNMVTSGGFNRETSYDVNFIDLYPTGDSTNLLGNLRWFDRVNNAYRILKIFDSVYYKSYTAVSYTPTTYALFLNGVKDNDYSFAAPAVNTINLKPVSTFASYGIDNIILFPTALTDTECEQLTS